MPGGRRDVGAKADRPAVYLLHGLLGTSYAHFAAQIVAWQRRYRLVPVDLPGHGRCAIDAADDYTEQAFAYVLGAMRKFGRGHVVAASYLGGPLGVRAARERPDLVQTLTLTGFVPGLSKSVFLAWCAAFRRLTEGPAELGDGFDRMHGPRWRRTLAAFAEDAELRYEDRIRVSGETLGSLAAPTLIANGAFKSVEREAAERAAALGPRTDGRVMKRGGHLPCYDDPEAFTAATEGFWREVAVP